MIKTCQRYFAMSGGRKKVRQKKTFTQEVFEKKSNKNDNYNPVHH